MDRYVDVKRNVFDTFFFCDHDRWTTLRRLTTARILYRHSISLGVLSPKVNWKCFVKVYIITNPTRFHSNPSHEAFGKDDKSVGALTWQWQKDLFQSNLSCCCKKVFDTLGRQWAHNNVQNGPRLLIYGFVNSWKQICLISTHTASFFNTVVNCCIGGCHFGKHSKLFGTNIYWQCTVFKSLPGINSRTIDS